MLILYVVLVIFNLTGSDGLLTSRPEKSTLIPGTLLRLNYDTERNDSILWIFTPEGSGNNTAMTSFGVLTPRFRPYFYLATVDIHEKLYGDCPRGTPPSGGLNARVVAKYSDFFTFEMLYLRNGAI